MGKFGGNFDKKLVDTLRPRGYDHELIEREMASILSQNSAKTEKECLTKHGNQTTLDLTSCTKREEIYIIKVCF